MVSILWSELNSIIGFCTNFTQKIEFQKMVLVDKTGSKETRDVRRYIKEHEADVF